VVTPRESSSFSHQLYRSVCSILAIDIDHIMTI
jgi:hypothetical protein